MVALVVVLRQSVTLPEEAGVRQRSQRRNGVDLVTREEVPLDAQSVVELVEVEQVL
jgi:hypothetical protein